MDNKKASSSYYQSRFTNKIVLSIVSLSILLLTACGESSSSEDNKVSHIDEKNSVGWR